MGNYLFEIVTAPDWMADFHCAEGDCPHTCCQGWNIEVDGAHGKRFAEMEDTKMKQLLLKGKVRRTGNTKADEIYRLQLRKFPLERCPLMTAGGKCSMQLSFGADILCDTCYFFPRLFKQIDGAAQMTASLACPEAARRALFRNEPVRFLPVRAEIDPAAEWLETEMIPDPGVREILRNHNRMIAAMIDLLQDRSKPMPERVADAAAFIAGEPVPGSFDESEMIPALIRTFDRGTNGLEKPFGSIHSDLMLILANGFDPADVIVQNYLKARDSIYLPFLANELPLEENFMVHLVFSDTLKQFGIYMNSDITETRLRAFESQYLKYSFALFRLLQCKEIMRTGTITREQFLRTVYLEDRRYWHYPAWFYRMITSA